MRKSKTGVRELSSGGSRRDFMRGSAAAVAMTVLPASVLGGPRRVPPSEKLSIAGIGVGGQGSWDLDNVSSQNIVALCDVDWARAADTFKRYPKVRVMLEKEKSIDAVVVATPDHNHAVTTMPYHPTYVPFAWRGWWDFGSGGLGRQPRAIPRGWTDLRGR